MRFLRSFATFATFAAGLLLMSLPTSAWAIGGNSGWFAPTGVWAGDNGEVIILGNGILNPDSCATSGYIVIPATMPGKDTFLSIALTAKATGKRLNFWMVGCVTSLLGQTTPYGAIIESE